MQPIILKLLLVGASSVGKSSLLIRFTDDTFTPTDDTAATIGVDFKVKMLERSGKRYKLNIWVCTAPCEYIYMWKVLTYKTLKLGHSRPRAL